MASDSPTASALLTYNAFDETLSGTIPGNDPFLMKAFSGGSRGHKVHPSKSPAEKAIAASIAKENLYDQASGSASWFGNTPEVKKDGKYVQRGGIIPAGHYACEYCETASVGKDVVKLTGDADSHFVPTRYVYGPFPTGGNKPRDGFYIHGHGNKGSDGCIVPDSPSERLRLSYAIRDFDGDVTLWVRHVTYNLPGICVISD